MVVVGADFRKPELRCFARVQSTLGLGHSNNDDAIMWPYIGTRNPGLHSEDINRVQSLYGEQMSDIRNILL